MGTSPSLLFRQLLPELPRGSPLPSAWLQERGLNAKQVARLAEDGWLQRLGHGIYVLPGDQLNREASLACLAESVPGLHVASKTALAWRGVRHNLPFKEQLSLWGDKPVTLPVWFTTAFPARYQATHLFDESLDAKTGLAPLPAGHADVLVSTPERALLELLSDVGKGQELEEARHLVEGARTLRLPVLDELLAHLTRIKVARLAHSLADELELSWVDLARRHSERLGGGQRWVSTTKTGERLNLKRPS
jgi:Transcriptional regulator, AbiEi antitoxin, Type IV TA system/Transcriptional regulator, AbiEi antitoxin N-terminal domain